MSGGSQMLAKERDAPAVFCSRNLRGRCFRRKLAGGGVDASSAGCDRDMLHRCVEQDDNLTGGVLPAVPVVLSDALH